MNKFNTETQSPQAKLERKKLFSHTYYGVLGLHPSASSLEIRKAYRDLSKLYHPDTTLLSTKLAKTKFQELNEAYATLCNPQKRSLYDLKIGYSRWHVIQPNQKLKDLNNHQESDYLKSAYLDATERPLSAGEVFALFMMGFTILGCLFLALIIAWLRGDVL